MDRNSLECMGSDGETPAAGRPRAGTALGATHGRSQLRWGRTRPGRVDVARPAGAVPRRRRSGRGGALRPLLRAAHLAGPEPALAPPGAADRPRGHRPLGLSELLRRGERGPLHPGPRRRPLAAAGRPSPGTSCSGRSGTRARTAGRSTSSVPLDQVDEGRLVRPPVRPHARGSPRAGRRAGTGLLAPGSLREARAGTPAARPADLGDRGGHRPLGTLRATLARPDPRPAGRTARRCLTTNSNRASSASSRPGAFTARARSLTTWEIRSSWPSPERDRLLVELICIDLEFRWRNSRRRRAGHAGGLRRAVPGADLARPTAARAHRRGVPGAAPMGRPAFACGVPVAIPRETGADPGGVAPGRCRDRGGGGRARPTPRDLPHELPSAGPADPDPDVALLSHRDFLLRRLIGAGRMGKVYEARSARRRAVMSP